MALTASEPTGGGSAASFLPPPTPAKHSKTPFLAVGALLVVAAALALWHWYPRSPQLDLGSRVEQQLMKTNPAFKDAQFAFASQDYKAAVTSYERALQTANGHEQSAFIGYYLGMATDLSGDQTASIPILKKVAADTSAPTLFRAYAVMFMARLLSSYGDGPQGTALSKEIFKDAPYNTMVDAHDSSVTTRHLYEYASSIQPLVLSELRIADWYAKAIAFNNLSTTTEPGRSYLQTAKDKLAASDQDIYAMAHTPFANLMPEALSRKAVVMSELAHRGAGTLQEADLAYAAAVASYQAYKMRPGEDGGTRFAYAGYLSHTHGAQIYGATLSAKVHEIISPLYADPTTYADSSIVAFLRSVRQTRSTADPQTAAENNKLRAMQISYVDPDFKTFLLSLGWTAKDFLPASAIDMGTSSMSHMEGMQ